MLHSHPRYSAFSGHRSPSPLLPINKRVQICDIICAWCSDHSVAFVCARLPIPGARAPLPALAATTVECSSALHAAAFACRPWHREDPPWLPSASVSASASISSLQDRRVPYVLLEEGTSQVRVFLRGPCAPARYNPTLFSHAASSQSQSQLQRRDSSMTKWSRFKHSKNDHDPLVASWAAFSLSKSMSPSVALQLPYEYMIGFSIPTKYSYT